MKILVADDDPVILHQLCIFLNKWQYEHITFSKGLDVWECIQSGEAPNIMILDWEMPGMDGTDICRRIRSMNTEPSPYILLLSAKNDQEYVVKGMEAGADDYITKPFYPHELHVRIKAGFRIVRLQEQLMEARDRLEIEATHDPLTGVLNRGAIMKTVAVELERARREKKWLCVTLLDIDHFKQINDTYGHQVGDEVLREFSARLNEVLRPYDTLGRYGGEEFLMLFPGCDLEKTAKLTERVKHIIKDIPINIGEQAITITASFGVCVLQGELRPEVDSVIKLADDALYRAKNQGRDCIIIETYQ